MLRSAWHTINVKLPKKRGKVNSDAQNIWYPISSSLF